LDWNNPEGDRCPFDLTKPLPLKGRPGHLTVAAKYFFNNDLEFMKSSDPEKTYTSTIKNTNSFGFHPFQFSYPPRKLTMEEMLYKFIDEGRRKHEEMGAFIREFKTTNELLLKERNNSLSELEFEVYGLSKAINNAQLSNYEVKGVTTRGGKTTTEIIHDVNKEPPILHHDKPVEPSEVLVKTKPQETKEQAIQPPTPLITFPHMLKKEKEEA
ncbi:hypothetical protein Tco_0905099, partial [Tanacetum coccineum]